ncbi:hypothetical protein GCM10023080_017590 [Streptomyces pseudoechinosporeus]
MSSHPLRWYFEYRRPGLHLSVIVAWWKNPIQVAVEQTLTILVAAVPVGLDGKRRDFHALTDMSGTGRLSTDRLFSSSQAVVYSSLGIPPRTRKTTPPKTTASPTHTPLQAAASLNPNAAHSQNGTSSTEGPSQAGVGSLLP